MCAHGSQTWNEWVRGNLAQRILHAAARCSLAEACVPILLVQPDAQGRVVFPFRHILVPLDGSAAHEQGLAPAARLAGHLRIPVLLFTAIGPRASVRGRRGATARLLPHATTEVMRVAEEEARLHLEDHVRELRASGVDAAGRVARGEPALGIVETAAEVGADLIVLGTHALTATGAFWEGSVTPRVLQKARTSFLLAPGSDAAASP
jgi:nucleotide-binding universal stress UspA family protein